MPRRGGIGWLVAAALALAAPGARAAGEAPAADCALAATDRVQARYEGLLALRARFRQTTWSVAFGGDSGPEAVAAEGRVEFAKPGRMRWEYEKPAPSLVVSDGSTLWIYDPTAREVQVLSVDQGFLSAAAIQFLLGQGRLRESFEVAARSCSATRAELELRPRADASYERIELAVDPGTGWIQETTVTDLLGNRTHVVFEGV